MTLKLIFFGNLAQVSLALLSILHHILFSGGSDWQEKHLNWPKFNGGAQWTLQSGSSLGNQPSHLQASNSDDAINSPGSRAGSAGWEDAAGNFFLFGGKGYDNQDTETPHYLNDLWVYNKTTETWMMLKENGSNKNTSNKRTLPKPRQGAVMCGIDGTLLFLFGGQTTAEALLSDTWIYTILTNSWLPLYLHQRISQRQPIHPSARTASFSWCFRDRVIIHAGALSLSTLANDLWEFSFQNLTWHEMKGTSSPSARCCGSAWSNHHEHLYLFGGSSDATSAVKEYNSYKPIVLLNDMYIFNLRNFSWSQLKTPQSPQARQFCSHWTDLNGDLWLTHGMTTDSNELLNDAWKFNTSNQTWIQVDINSSSAPSSRFRSLAWCSKDSAFLFGGLGFDGRHKMSLLNDFWSFRSPWLNGSAISHNQSFLEHFTPALVFLITMVSAASVVCVFGLVFCMKKIFEYPFRASSTAYNVRYTPLKEETSFELS